jgi:hypothetical protein
MAEPAPDAAADRDAIRDLLARYTYNGDRGRIEALAACFADDGTLEYPGNRASGPAAITSRARRRQPERPARSRASRATISPTR